MWSNDNRAAHERKSVRYPSDLTGAEWALVEPHLPPPKKDRRGRPPVDRRAILDGILYVLTTGCQWSQLPKDLPPKSTVHDYLVDWNGDGTLRRIHNALYRQAREAAGREAAPTLAIVDSQSVKSAEKGGLTAIPPAMMRPRRSRARSATLPSTPRA